MESTIDEISQQVSEMIVDAIEENNEAILDCIKSDLQESIINDEYIQDK